MSSAQRIALYFEAFVGILCALQVAWFLPAYWRNIRPLRHEVGTHLVAAPPFYITFTVWSLIGCDCLFTTITAVLKLHADSPPTVMVYPRSLTLLLWFFVLKYFLIYYTQRMRNLADHLTQP